MLSPKKQKYRKAHKGRVKITCKRGTFISYGEYGLKALESDRVTGAQIESARRAAVKCMSRRGKIWIRVFPHLPVSKKPAEVRMGKGKGAVAYHVSRISPGRILFEIGGVSESISQEALRLASAKLPIKTKVVCRYGVEV